MTKEYLYLVSVLEKFGICYGSTFRNCRSRVCVMEVNLQLNRMSGHLFVMSCTLQKNVNKTHSYSFCTSVSMGRLWVWMGRIMAQYNSTAQQSRGNLEGIPAGISKYSQCNNQVRITLESCLSVGYLMLLNTFKNPSAKGSMPLNGT